MMIGSGPMRLVGNVQFGVGEVGAIQITGIGDFGGSSNGDGVGLFGFEAISGDAVTVDISRLAEWGGDD